MRIIACLAGVWVFAAAAGAALAAETAPQQDRLTAMRTALDAGLYAEASAAARQFIGGARDDQAKTEALRILAVALRKQGEWRQAAKAYGDLKDRYEKGSEFNVRYEAAAEVLAASPKGFYPPMAPPSGAETARTLADDAVLGEALVRVGETRAEKLKTVAAAMKKAATGKDVAAKFAEVIDGLAKARYLAPNLPVTQDREAAEAAADALDRLEKEVGGNVRTRLAELEKAIVARNTVSTPQRKQLTECQDVCQQMIAAEESFRETLRKVPGQGWLKGLGLGLASGKRTADYTRLHNTCRLLLAANMLR
jgi:hypothetical protein